MTLTQMQQDLYDRHGYQSSPPAEIVRRLLRFLNESHREVLGKKWCSSYRRALLTFSSVANSPFAVLPQATSHVRVIADRVNSWPLAEISLEDLRYQDPGLTASSGYPDRYTTLNYAAAVAKDPSNASAIFIKSDDVLDVQIAYMEGITTGGYVRSTNVTLTGTTAVAFPGTDWIALTKFYLATAATGNITLNEDSGIGTELARITPGRLAARYTRIHLYPTPTTAVTFYADVDRMVLDLVNATDEPLLHEDWHWVLVAYASSKEFLKREKAAESDRELSRYTNGVKEMQVFLSQRSGVATGSQRAPQRFSQLGPMFRSGS